MPSPDEDILRRGMRALGDAVHGEAVWDEIAERRRRLAVRRRRRTVTTVLIVVLALVGAGTVLVRAFFTDAVPKPGNQPGPRPTTLQGQLEASPGTLIDHGMLGADSWRLYLFEDPDDFIDGSGPNLYVDRGRGTRDWLDRPDPPLPIDVLRSSSSDGRSMLIVGVATSEVVSVELVFGDRRVQAQFVDVDDAAFDRAYWVSGSVPAGLFRGTLISRDASGAIIDERTFTARKA